MDTFDILEEQKQTVFNDKGLAQQIQALMDAEDDDAKRKECLISITMRLSQMCHGGGDLLMAYGKEPEAESGEIELVRMGPDDKPIFWMAATALEEVPEGLLEVAEFKPVKAVTMLDKLLNDEQMAAIVINPFSYDGRLFMINKEMANLAMNME